MAEADRRRRAEGNKKGQKVFGGLGALYGGTAGSIVPGAGTAAGAAAGAAIGAAVGSVAGDVAQEVHNGAQTVSSGAARAEKNVRKIFGR